MRNHIQESMHGPGISGGPQGIGKLLVKVGDCSVPGPTQLSPSGQTIVGEQSDPRSRTFSSPNPQTGCRRTPSRAVASPSHPLRHFRRVSRNWVHGSRKVARPTSVISQRTGNT